MISAGHLQLSLDTCITVLLKLRQSQHYKVPDGDWLCPDCEPVVEKNEEESSDSGECSEEEQVC